MSTELTSPFGGAVIEVSDDLVGRYVEAGWKTKSKAPAKKAAVKKAPAKSGDDK